MFWFVMGLPTRFTAWCEEVVASLAGADGWFAPVVSANTPEELAFRVLRQGVSRAVVASAQPAHTLRSALAAANRRYVVALGDPGTALLQLVLQQSMALPEAIQLVAGSCAAFEAEAVAGAGALILWADRDDADPIASALAIAEHLGFAVDDAKLVELSSLYQQRPLPSEQDAAAWWSSLEPAAQSAITGALGAYTDRDVASGTLSIVWRHDLFFHGDQPGIRVNGPVDITGRARCLIAGPHILLPRGTWALSLTLAFSREAAEREFAVEVHTNQLLASGMMRPSQEGGGAVHLEFALDDGNQQPVDIRVSSLRAAFDGSISVEAATLVRLAAPPRDAGIS